ncbi:MAG: SAF domain-containing protein [Clostridia bacterium]|nr:SAF domain-containing protein [Clostridia bacterium]
MASNPMQKKARNSFLLGMVITLVICALIGGLFYILTAKQNQKKEEEEGVLTYVYKLKTNVMSGATITANNVEEVLVTTKAVPAGAYASRKETKNEKGKTEWKKQAFTGVGKKARVNLNAGTILTESLLYTGEDITSDLRYVEYNMLSLSTTVDVGSYIDIRLALPNGLDLIVVSEKEVKSIIGNTIGLELTEDEILMMESAIVEAYVMTASKLYAIEYVSPGTQVSAATGEVGTLVTYTPTQAVQDLIKASGNNIQEVAKNALLQRFNQNVRDNVASDVNRYSDEKLENIEEKLQVEIENAKAAREAYLSGLTSY